MNRREFLRAASLGGTAALFGARPAAEAADALETTRLKLVQTLGICVAPQYIAEALLQA